MCSLRAGRLVRQAIDVADALAIQYAQTQGCQGKWHHTCDAVPGFLQGGLLVYHWPQKTCVLGLLGMVNDIV